jgi:hypothetical protein
MHQQEYERKSLALKTAFAKNVALMQMVSLTL